MHWTKIQGLPRICQIRVSLLQLFEWTGQVLVFLHSHFVLGFFHKDNHNNNNSLLLGKCQAEAKDACVG